MLPGRSYRLTRPHTWALITGGTGDESSKFGVSGTLVQIASPTFCIVSKFEAPDRLHLMRSEAYQPHYSNWVFTVFQKYIFNVHQIQLQEKNSFFSGEDTDKNTAQNASKYAISSEEFIFLRRRPIQLQTSPPVERGTPSSHPTHHPHQAFWILPYVFQNSSQIYATGHTVMLHTVLLVTSK